MPWQNTIVNYYMSRLTAISYNRQNLVHNLPSIISKHLKMFIMNNQKNHSYNKSKNKKLICGSSLFAIAHSQHMNRKNLTIQLTIYLILPLKIQLLTMKTPKKSLQCKDNSTKVIPFSNLRISIFSAETKKKKPQGKCFSSS